MVHTATGSYLGHRLEDDDFLSVFSMLTVYELPEPHFCPDFNESELNQRCDVLVGALGWIIESQTHG